MSQEPKKSIILEVDSLSGAYNYSVVDAPGLSRVNNPITFLGEKQVSSRGNPILSYPIPGTNTTYIFAFSKKTMRYEQYYCVKCKGLKKTRTIAVRDNKFLEDPCTIGHICTPVEAAKEIALRTSYEMVNKIKTDPTSSNKPPLQHWLNTLKEIDQNPKLDDDTRAKVMDEFRGEGFSHKKRTIRRAANTGDKATPVTMDNVPSYLANLRDGSAFLQLKQHDMHVYISDLSLEKACRNALYVLVGDGVHSKAPRCVRKGSQLYVIHGICRGGVDVPLLYAIMEKKDKAAYETILLHLKTHLLRYDVNLKDLRFVVDYERAAIAAIRSTFEGITVQGCAFHLALAWNRRRNGYGLTRFITGNDSVPEVLDWWNTIKGLIFLPKRLHSVIPALKKPPVPQSHPAFTGCSHFLNYLATTWYRGSLANLWDKSGVTDIRTTNVAEAFHRRLGVLLQDYPTLAEVIEVFHALEIDCRSALNSAEMHPERPKKISQEAQERRAEITAAMNTTQFEEQYGATGVTRVQAEEYCKRMARYVTDKAF